MSEDNGFWGVLELMGHVRTAGRITEVEMFGSKMGRIDIPQGEGFVTQFFGGSSVYRLSPCGEAEARAVAASSQPEPVHRWEFPRNLLPASVDEREDIDQYDEGDR